MVFPLNKGLRWNIADKWKYADDFSEDLARVMNDKGYYGYIDKSGNEVIPYQEEYAYEEIYFDFDVNFNSLFAIQNINNH